MHTLVCFHAHPDDEAIATGGLMARVADEGGRVVLVVATRGERGEPQPGILAEGEALWERRIPETFEAAAALGVQRVEFLGYVDSGMMGEPTNDFPYSFWGADVDHAAGRLAAILTEEGADLLTIYDDNGGYGHPDHIQVHRVGLRAAEIAGTPRVFQSTMNRTRIQEAMAEHGDEAESQVGGEVEIPTTPEEFGKPEDDITHGIDVRMYLKAKRAALEAHASQISGESFFLQLDDELFALAFGTEWYIETGRPRPSGEALRTDIW